MQRFGELGIADAGAQVDERAPGHLGGGAEMLKHFGLVVGLLALVGQRAFGVSQIDRDLDLQHVDVVAVLGELAHRLDHDLRFLLGEFQALLASTLLVVADELQEERNAVGLALVADALDEGVLFLVALFRLERRVVDQHFDGVRACFLDAAHGHVGQQVRLPARAGVVVPALFVAEQQSGVLVARGGGGHAPLRVQQDGARVRRQDLRNRRLELNHHCVRDLVDADAFTRGDGLLQRTALVHGRGGNHAALIGQSFHMPNLFFGNFHAHGFRFYSGGSSLSAYRRAGR